MTLLCMSAGAVEGCLSMVGCPSHLATGEYFQLRQQDANIGENSAGSVAHFGMKYAVV